jgi:membrane associated rhomboid family serine protease
MDRLLARLERRLGRYAVPNLIVYVVAGMAIVWLLSQARPWALSRLDLDMGAVRRGEFWRLLTFLFVPLGSGYFVFLALYFTFWVGSRLEQHWGSFRFDVYYLLGALGAVAAAVVSGHGSNTWIDSSMLLAFATIAPEETILIFFILPLRVKWLGLFTAALMGYALVRGEWTERAAIVASSVNYLLFFGAYWWGLIGRRNVAVRQKSRREELRSGAPVFGQRVCAVCGAREADGADIRVCSCEKCGPKQRSLCLQHARNH